MLDRRQLCKHVGNTVGNKIIANINLNKNAILKHKSEDFFDIEVIGVVLGC